MVLTRVFGVRGMKVVERRKPPPGNGIRERSVRQEHVRRAAFRGRWSD